MKPPFSIAQIVQEQLIANHEERDGSELHVADLYKCAYEVWARRHGLEKVKPGPETLLKWRYGHLIEQELVDLARPGLEALGWEVVHGGLIEGVRNGIAYTGHPDLRIYHHEQKKIVVFDTKTSTFYPTKIPDGTNAMGKTVYKNVRIPPESPSTHYQIQTNGYACHEALTHPDYKVGWGIFLACRDSAQITDFDTLHAPDLEEFDALLVEYNALTGDEAKTPPPAEPPAHSFNSKGVAWPCRYCSNATCPKNENADALSTLTIAS